MAPYGDLSVGPWGVVVWSGSPYESGLLGQYSYGDCDGDFLGPPSEGILLGSIGSRHKRDTEN